MEIEINPTLFIGLGGTGHLFTSNLKEIINKEFVGDSNLPLPLMRYLVIDTEFISIPYKGRVLTDEEEKLLVESKASIVGRGADFSYQNEQITSCIVKEEQCEIQVKPKQMNAYIRDHSLLGIEDFMPADLGDIQPGTFGAGQIGLLGKIMGANHFHPIFTSIDDAFQSLVGTNIDSKMGPWRGRYRRRQISGNPLSVYISCSMSGGTGRGLYMMIAAMVRHMMCKLHIEENGKIFLINFVPDCFETAGRVVPVDIVSNLKANQYAAFKELDHVMNTVTDGDQGSVEMENFFKMNVGKDPKIGYSLKLFDGVYLVSSRIQGGTGSKLDSYKMVNDIAGRAIASLVFSNFQGPIEASLADYVSYPPMEEGKTKVERIRKYARIGRAALRYPVRRLIEYLKNYVCYQAVLDLKEGILNLSPVEHAPDCADREFQRIAEFIGQRFAARSIFTFEHMGEDSFETPFVSKLQDRFISELSSLISNHDEQEKFLIEDSGRSYIREEMGVLKTLLSLQIKDYGLDRAEAILDAMVDCITGYWNSAMADRLNLQRKDMTSRQEFLNALNNEITSIETSTAIPFTDAAHPMFDSVRRYLEADAKRWKDERSWRQKLGISREDTKVVSSDTKRTVEALINDFFEKVIRPLQKDRNLRTTLRFLRKLEDELKNLRRNLEKSEAVITRREEQGKYRGIAWRYHEAMKSIANEVSDPTELYVFGRSQSEYDNFCKEFPKRCDIFERVQERLNEAIVPKCFDASVTEEGLQNVLEQAAFREVERYTGENALSIHTFFKGLYDNEKYDEIASLWTSFHGRAAWLGTVSPDRIGFKHKSHGSFIIHQFLEISYPQAFMGCTAAQSLFGSGLKVIQRNLRETFILTKYQITIPLFVNDSIYETGEEYDRLARRSDSKAVATLAKYHTALQFFYVDEPLGMVTHIPFTEMNATLNLILHLVIIRVDQEGYLECVQQKGGDSRPKLCRWLTDRDKIDINSGILFEEFQRNPSNYSELMVHLLTWTTRLFTFLAAPPTNIPPDLRSDFQNTMTGYLIDETFPIIPETLLQNRLLKVPAIERLFNQTHINEGYKKKKINFSKNLVDLPAFRSLQEMLDQTGFKHPSVLKIIHDRLTASGTFASLDDPVKPQQQNTPEVATKSATVQFEQTETPSVRTGYEETKARLEELKKMKEEGLLPDELYNEVVRKEMSRFING